MEFVFYIVKVNLALILFYGFYNLLFRQDTFFAIKRGVLLSILLVSLLYPFVNIIKSSDDVLLKQIPVIREISIYALFVGGELNSPPTELKSGEDGNVKSEEGRAFNFSDGEELNSGDRREFNFSSVERSIKYDSLLFIILLNIYLIVIMVLLCRMLIQIFNVHRKIKKSQPVKFYETVIFKFSGLKTPFSFFKWILLDPTRYTEIELKEILLHEKTHVKQWHSIDMFLSELICAFCWFNPFVWLIKRELRMNLEFLADNRVVNSGCKAEHYQFHLLRLSSSGSSAGLSNNFNASPLKRRISMMNKKETTLIGMLKYMLLFPLIYFFFLFNGYLNVNAGNEIEQMGLEEEIYSFNNYKKEELIKKMKEESNLILESDSASIYSKAISSMPGFIEGRQEITNWITTNIEYPEGAISKGVQGRVMVRFMIRKDGSVENSEILRSVDPLLDEEVLRVINTMPKRKPAVSSNGNRVTVYYTIPLLFELSGHGSSQRRQ